MLTFVEKSTLFVVFDNNLCVHIVFDIDKNCVFCFIENKSLNYFFYFQLF